jgi:hypothetical protein
MTLLLCLVLLLLLLLALSKCLQGFLRMGW